MATGVNPGDAAVVLKVLQDTWDLASERMLDTVARRLARGITSPGWAEQKAREVLALRSELAGIAQRLNQTTPAAVQAALDEAYRIGAGAADVVGQTAVRSRPEAVQRLATRLTQNLQGAALPVIRAHTDLFQKAVGESELLMTTGTITRRDAVAQTVDRLLVEGHDRFRDAAGRRWHLDTYARMAGRTAAGQSMVQGQLDDMVARGRDLVVISDSPRECEHCRPWEGRVLSITGQSVGQEVDGRRVTGTVSEARGAGLWHPNCTHRADPYTPGLTRLRTPKENPEGYKEQQQLRALERQSRDLKRRLAAAEKLGATKEARVLRAKVRENSARINAHAEATGQLRRRDRERPVGGGSAPTAPTQRVPEPRTPTPEPTPAPARRAPDREPEPVGPKVGDLLSDDVMVPAARRAEIRSAVGEALDGEYSGLRVEVIDAKPSPGQLEIGANILNRDGKVVGEAWRVLGRDEDGKLWAKHDFLQLNDTNLQGQGFAKAFNQHLYDWYRRSGVERVELHANIDVGGYAWARAGYDFASAQAAEDILGVLRWRLSRLPADSPVAAAARDILERAESVPFGDDRYPSAYEISQLGRTPGAKEWLGKTVMLGSEWDGVMWL